MEQKGSSTGALPPPSLIPCKSFGWNGFAADGSKAGFPSLQNPREIFLDGESYQNVALLWHSPKLRKVTWHSFEIEVSLLRADWDIFTFFHAILANAMHIFIL